MTPCDMPRAVAQEIESCARAVIRRSTSDSVQDQSPSGELIPRRVAFVVRGLTGWTCGVLLTASDAVWVESVFPVHLFELLAPHGVVEIVRPDPAPPKVRGQPHRQPRRLRQPGAERPRVEPPPTGVGPRRRRPPPGSGRGAAASPSHGRRRHQGRPGTSSHSSSQTRRPRPRRARATSRASVWSRRL